MNLSICTIIVTYSWLFYQYNRKDNKFIGGANFKSQETCWCRGYLYSAFYCAFLVLYNPTVVFIDGLYCCSSLPKEKTSRCSDFDMWKHVHLYNYKMVTFPTVQSSNVQHTMKNKISSLTSSEMESISRFFNISLYVANNLGYTVCIIKRELRLSYLVSYTCNLLLCKMQISYLINLCILLFLFFFPNPLTLIKIYLIMKNVK